MIKRIFFPNDSHPKHIKSLDGLRGIAILIVIISHGCDLGYNMGIDFQKFGKTGVYLFFILSAFLLDKQIIYAFENKKSNLRFWLNYTVRRFLRIFPLFLISLLVYFILNKFVIHTLIDSKEILIEHLTFRRGDIFYWSIAPELEYYLLSPILILFFLLIIKWNLKNIISSLIIIVFLLTVINFTRPSIIPYFSIFKSLPIFLLGTILAFIWVKSKHHLKVNSVIALGCVILLILTVPGIWNALIDYKLPVSSFEMTLPYGILLSVIFINAISSNSIINKVAEWKFLRFLGNISFSLYLFHWGVGLIVMKYFSSYDILQSLIYFFTSIFFSSITYSIIESPLSKIRFTRNN